MAPIIPVSQPAIDMLGHRTQRSFRFVYGFRCGTVEWKIGEDEYSPTATPASIVLTKFAPTETVSWSGPLDVGTILETYSLGPDDPWTGNAQPRYDSVTIWLVEKAERKFNDDRTVEYFYVTARRLTTSKRGDLQREWKRMRR